ncbi:DUF4262 domain-containing protein [Streptomyces sp. SID8381]|uniref:DUF4262 domain-containing protein n=1 Tax=unclassified Streptomyces TaxID=2593676 RepID=UPI0003624356|nr:MULTISPECIES: DUF4262 domain-containing protein [unclassified Streptomyces]MYX26816.1 DUF4262 domain-containing protein [Streptomyces sp. SID8381]
MDSITADSRIAAPAYSHEVRWIFDTDGSKPPFAYTVGLGARPGRPYELACAGLPAELACSVLNNAAEQLVTDRLDPAEGLELDDVLIGYTVRLRPVSDTSDFPGMCAPLGEQPPVWQVLWPDVRGRFPGDEDHRDDPHQPLL